MQLIYIGDILSSCNYHSMITYGHSGKLECCDPPVSSNVIFRSLTAYGHPALPLSSLARFLIVKSNNFFISLPVLGIYFFDQTSSFNLPSFTAMRLGSNRRLAHHGERLATLILADLAFDRHPCGNKRYIYRRRKKFHRYST